MKKVIRLYSSLFAALAVLGSTGIADAVSSINLPSGEVTLTLTDVFPPDAYFQVVLSGVPAGFDVTNGTYEAWCINPYLGINDTSYGAWLFSSINGSLPRDLTNANWSCINYVINRKAYYMQALGADYWDLQNAIWYFALGYYPGDFSSAPQAGAIVNDASANGRNFVPATGQKAAVITDFDLYPAPETVQDLIIEVIVPPAPQIQSVTIGDYVWNDANANGVQDSGETGFAGVGLTLVGTNTSGALVTDHTTTDNTGHYGFNETPGTYVVSVDATNFNAGGPLSGYVPTLTGKGTQATDSNGSPSGTTPATLAGGQSDQTVDFGYYQPVTIGDFVWNDLNGNGIQDAGEPGIPGVTVTLTGTSAAGNPVTATTTTDASGHYLFTEPPGTYTVTVTPPAGYVATATGKGTPATDSNASPSGTTPGALAAGAADLNVDFGFYQPVTIGDFVWNDLNGNGVQDLSEPGISGVTLTLTGVNGAGSAVSATTTTDVNGAYSFTEPPGTYTVTVTPPAGYVATATGKGTSATDSNPSPSGTTPTALPSGGSDQTIDFGLYQPVTIGNFVWNDLNGNGVKDIGEPGIPGVTVTLTGVNGAGSAVSATTTTDGNGNYSFTEAPGTYTVTVTAPAGYTATATGKGTTATDSNVSPSGTTPGTLVSGGSDATIDFGFYKPVTIGDFVWNDLNGNGVQDAGEPGIAGVTVTLTGTDGAANPVSATTTTDVNGKYSFTEAPGTYTVAVTTPVGYTATAPGKGTAATDSNPSPSGTTPAALPSGGSDLTVDFGFYAPVAIGDFVWLDTNGNGVQDAGEPGITNVGLTLIGTNDVGNVVTNHQTTDATGHYVFAQAPGAYLVSVDATNFLTGGPLAGYSATVTGMGTTTNDSNANPSGTTPPTLVEGESDLSLDFGFYQLVKIGDFVWNDLNGNGVQDAGEPGIAGVTVTLTGSDGAGNPVNATTTTDANGFYQFTEPPGTYAVSVVTPAGYTPTATGKGTTATDSNPSPSSTALPSGGSDQTIDFGFYQPVTIGNFVWNDLNGNGVQDAGEPGIAGVTVTLTGMTGSGVAVTATTTTDANGAYSFTEPPGTYTVSVATPAGFMPTVTGQGTAATDSNPSPSGTTPGTLASGGSDQTVDFGFYQPVTIGNFVWNDLNGNGVQDAGEPGIPGVTLALTGTTGSGVSVTATTTTDANGYYQFTEPPGTYAVSVVTPAGYAPTAAGKGTVATDSNPSLRGTTPGALASGGSDQTIDFGFCKPVTIGDFVWNDANANGMQDAGETGIAGVTVTLTGTDGAGNPVTATATTDANGAYSFTEPPGTYTVNVSTPVGFTPTLTGQGTAATDSNPNPSGTTPTTLTSGSSDTSIDFGFYQTVSIGDFVWSDTNGNGMQDGGEPGITNVGLTLVGTNLAGVVVTNHTTTDGTGHYGFTEPPGSYSVSVDATNFAAGGPLSGYQPTVTGQGTPATDSNPSPSGTTLVEGGSDLTIDFGFYQPVTIGNFVWNDLNGNGIQDAGEPGITNVTVTLTGTDGTGNVVNATTNTDASGYYSFTEPPGTYTVSVTAPPGFTPTLTGKGTQETDSNTNSSSTTPVALPSGGSDQTIDFGFYKQVTIGDFVWNDLNGNGVQDLSEPGIAGVTVTLTGTDGAGNPVTASTTTDVSGQYFFTEPPGTYTVSVATPAGFTPTVTGQGPAATDSNASPSGTTPGTLASGGSDLTIDFGFYQPVMVGDFVWNDLNGNGVQDSGEPGIPGVTLALTGTTGSGVSVTATTTTDANGHYQFTEPPGTYTVSVVTPAGYTPTATSKGTTATDSNPSPSSTGLPSGGSDQMIDFGFYKPVTIGDFVWNDANANGIQDTGEPGIAGVTVTLTGTDGAGNPVSATTTTDTNGKYSFTEPPGTYTVSVTALPGYTATAVGQGTSTTDSNPSPSGTTPLHCPRVAAI